MEPIRGVNEATKRTYSRLYADLMLLPVAVSVTMSSQNPGGIWRESKMKELAVRLQILRVCLPSFTVSSTLVGSTLSSVTWTGWLPITERDSGETLETEACCVLTVQRNVCGKVSLMPLVEMTIWTVLLVSVGYFWILILIIWFWFVGLYIDLIVYPQSDAGSAPY